MVEAMKTWAVSDKWFEMQLAVVAETRGRAKARAFSEFQSFGDDLEYIDLRCWRVKSPIPVEGPERVLNVDKSLEYGFRWNNETMDDFFPGWYNCWLCEERND
jgi:hypothetical protein